MKKKYANGKKLNVILYIIIIIIIFFALYKYVNNEIKVSLTCLLSILLFFIPDCIERIFKIAIPRFLKYVVYLFVFSAQMLGNANNFYGIVPIWDTILHIICGFLSASVGFSIIYIFYKKINIKQISLIFINIYVLGFSALVGISWEIFEYTMDCIFETDMQKDQYISKLNTVTLDPMFSNNVIKIDEIDYVVIYDIDSHIIKKIDGYLDIGLHDTMLDLISNFIGSIIFVIFGYYNILKKENKKFIEMFLLKQII